MSLKCIRAVAVCYIDHNDPSTRRLDQLQQLALTHTADRHLMIIIMIVIMRARNEGVLDGSEGLALSPKLKFIYCIFRFS